MSSLRRVLLISLGNPGNLRSTYHSAGHIVLESLQRQLGRDQPAFGDMRYGKASALVSIGYRYTLVQSPTSMNVSGPWVSSAIRQHFEDNMLSQEEGAVLLVHDDLELDLGVVKVRKWDSSHKGHNGVKSVQASPSKFVQGSAAKTARLCVGIGRPEGRDKRTVSDFVLSRIPKYDRSVLEGKATQKVFEALSELERKW